MRFRSLTTFSLCASLLVAPASAAPIAQTAKTAYQQTRDVALKNGGVLAGQILNSQGKGLENQPVVLGTSNKEIARTHTDKQGRFQIAGLQGGVYLVATVGQQSVVRLWAPHTAPPAAQQGVMLVASTDVVRGQCGCGTPVCGSAVGGGGGIGNWIANHPLLTAGAIATAIAVPLAVDDDDPPATP